MTNNLYEQAMKQALPISDCRWINNEEKKRAKGVPKKVLEKELNFEEFYNTLMGVNNENKDKGYVLEVDLENPEGITDAVEYYKGKMRKCKQIYRCAWRNFNMFDEHIGKEEDEDMYNELKNKMDYSKGILDEYDKILKDLGYPYEDDDFEEVQLEFLYNRQDVEFNITTEEYNEFFKNA